MIPMLLQLSRYPFTLRLAVASETKPQSHEPLYLSKNRIETGKQPESLPQPATPPQVEWSDWLIDLGSICINEAQPDVGAQVIPFHHR